MAALEKMLAEARRKLLDLTLRNSLLNYNQKRKDRIVIVDEIPNVIYNRLLSGEQLRFDPIPFPDEDVEAAEEPDDNDAAGTSRTSRISAIKYATILGIKTDEEAPLEETKDEHGDKNIQTLHFPDQLERLLQKKRMNAKSAIEETGSNLLYLAIGFLQWKDAQKQDKVFNAPLILIPVEIIRNEPDRKTGVYRYSLAHNGEELISNVSLLHKIRQDLGIELPALEDDEDPEDYFNKINAICAEHKDLVGVSRRFALDFFHFSKLLMYLDLNPDRWPHEKRLENHPVLAEIAGDTQLDETTSPLPSSDEDATEQLPLVLDADGSQRDAITRALNGRSLIIEGPPGTGKSQTISNLIAVALSKGKTVLFVAEKLVALEVVKKRLDDVGLGHYILELHSHKANKSSFYSGLRERVRHLATDHSDAREKAITTANYLKAEINNYLSELHNPVQKIEKTPFQIFGEVENNFRDEFANLPSYPQALQTHINTLTDLGRYFHAIEQMLDEGIKVFDSPWLGFTASGAIPSDSKHILSLFEQYTDGLSALSALLSADPIFSETEDTTHFLNTLDTAVENGLLENIPSISDLRAIQPLSDKQLTELFALCDEADKIVLALHDVDLEFLSNTEELRSLARSLREFQDIGFFGKLFNKDYKAAKRRVLAIRIGTGSMSPRSMLDFVEDAYGLLQQFDKTARLMQSSGLADLCKDIQKPDAAQLRAFHERIGFIPKLKGAKQWREGIFKAGIPSNFIERFSRDEQQEFAELLKRLQHNASSIQGSISSTLSQLRGYGSLNLEIFFQAAKSTHKHVQILKEKLQQSHELNAWIEASKILLFVENAGYEQLLLHANKHGIRKELGKMLLYVYYREWANFVLRERRSLAQFNRQLFEKTLARFCEIDRNLAVLHAKHHDASLNEKPRPEGRGGLVSEKTEMQLIRNEIEKQKRHIPIRQTLQRAPRAMRALKPCFMMSPLSVAQYVAPLQQSFDLLIIDEASQVFPEDAFGAIARAKQVVVVGDPNQLPPTSFFSSNMRDEADEEETSATASESILDLMLRVYPNSKRLKWHYRSRHESLIAFSNHHFYDKDLMIFPSPDRHSTTLGISRKYVNRGYFKDQHNPVEAEEMIDAIEEHLFNAPKEWTGYTP